jgi:hypothetical protein
MHRETVTWLLLMLATIILTYALDGEAAGASGLSDTARNALILAIAFVKVRIVAYEFMEIRLAPAVMRAATNAWVIGTCLILLLLFPARITGV